MHLVVTDSGLGGLAVCAGLERNFRRGAPCPATGATTPATGVRLTYVNAWPDERHGYNDLPDVAARAQVFGRALAALDRLQPDRIVIACNTLSILYEITGHRQRGGVPVVGIIDAGVGLFRDALAARPSSAIALFGTRTTIESGVHREKLIRNGIDPDRIRPVSCHGLARAIETDPDGRVVQNLIERCASAACEADVPGDVLYAGLCCTHYGYVAAAVRTALERRCRQTVQILDPNERLVADLAPPAATVEGTEGRAPSSPGGPPVPETRAVSVTVLSKVALDDRAREAIARLVEPTSPATARALVSYAHVPEMF